MRVLIPFVLSVCCVSAQTNWQVVWSDEFNGPAQSAPDPSKWTYDIGNNGWGNNELENYTNSTNNAYLDGNGNLVIHVKSDLTSARMKSQGLFSFTYGKVEARIKIPRGQGIWPAFWMLGTNIDTAGWPQCGEIDIMENIGREPNIVHGTVHGPDQSGNATGVGAPYSLSSGSFADDFHVYAVSWSPASVQFLVDDNVYFTVTPSTNYSYPWVFNTPFFIIMNVAVGGNWPGYPDSTTMYPQDMLVDYVRVSQPVPSVAAAVNAASFAQPIAPGGLGTIFGTNMAFAQSAYLFDSTQGAFSNNAQGTQVLVGGKYAPLTYADANQINFQVPWETPVGTQIPIQVVNNGISGNMFNATFAPVAPSAFLDSTQTAILSCEGGAPKTNAQCTLWGNGFGQTGPKQQDGKPSPPGVAPIASGGCTLTVGNAVASISYCGGAPGLVIDQLNFVYPAITVSGTATTVPAVLSVGGASISLQFPRPQ